MRKKHLFGILSLCLSIVGLASCVKEEDDFLDGETENTTIVKGKIVTTDGEPLPNITVKVDYNEGKWLQYSKTRHKAEGQTDKNGIYKLEFYVKDDEMEKETDSESGVNRDFYLIVDMHSLDPKQYILPSDMSSIFGADSPVAQPNPDVPPTIEAAFFPAPVRDTTYTENFYVPRKRYIKVTLKGFVPQQKNNFSVCTYFPWGGESDREDKMIDTPYDIQHCAVDVYVATSAEQTFEVPFALNENNIIKVSKLKEGIYSEEDIPVYVTKDTPAELVYEY